jgi:hypothetical protein
VDGLVALLGVRAGVGDLLAGGFQATGGDGGHQSDVFSAGGRADGDLLLRMMSADNSPIAPNPGRDGNKS